MSILVEKRQENENLELVNIDLSELKKFLSSIYDVFDQNEIDSFVKPTAGGI
jgi:hypothetical protein